MVDDSSFVLGLLCYCWLSYRSHEYTLHRVFTWFLLIVFSLGCVYLCCHLTCTFVGWVLILDFYLQGFSSYSLSWGWGCNIFGGLGAGGGGSRWAALIMDNPLANWLIFMSGTWDKTFKKISVRPIVLVVVTWEFTLGVNYWLQDCNLWSVKQRRPCELLHQVTLLRMKQPTNNKRRGAQDCLQIHQTAESRENHIQHALKLGQVWQSFVIMFKDSFQLNYMLSITIALGLGFKMGTKTKPQTQLQYSCRVEKPKLLMFCNM